MICRACRDWELAPRDAFCPGCGAFSLAVTIQTQVGGDGSSFPVIVLDRPADPALDDLTLALAKAPVSASTLASDPFDDLTLGDLAGETSFPLLDMAGDDPAAAVVGLHVVARVRGARRLVEPAVARQTAPAKAPALTLETVTFAADAVRPASERPSAGGWLMARIVNRGEAVALHGAALRLDRRRKSATPTLWPEPRVLLAGEAALLPVFLDAETGAMLSTLSGEVTGSVQFLDPSGRALGADHPARIARFGPLKASLALRPRLAALAGRTLRLPIAVTNTGGQAVHIVSAALVTRDAAADKSQRTELEPADGPAGLDPGQVGAWELRGPTPVASVEEALLEVVIAGRDGKRTLAQPFALEVRPAETPFAGRICVDFGTTASAVAAVVGRTPEPGDDGALATPFLVDLERVGVGGPGEGERFLASQAALTRSGAMVFGDAIDALPAHAVETRFAGFKWMLTSDVGFDVAVAYLARLKDLIETHPDVAGVIGLSTPVFATCPTRFAPGLRSRLVQAFRSAGFPDPRTGLFDHREAAAVLIAESWSPLPYALFADPARLRGLGADPAVVRPTLSLQEGQTGRAVVIDVGGGSADISVLSIALKKGRYRIAETYRRTDRAFVGDAFGALIEASLATLQRQGAAPSGRVDPDRLVQAVQHADGVFAGGAMRDLLTAHFAARLAGEDGRHDEAALRSALGVETGGGQTETLRAGFERRSPLLLGAPGDPEGLTLTEEGLIDLCGRVLADFTRAHLEPVLAMVREAVGEVSPDEPLLLIPSGRGVAFPLAQSLVVQAWRLCAGHAPLCILRPLEAKSITSWGGLVLADLAAAGANFDIELTDDFHVLAVAGRELQTDRIRLQPLPWLANDGMKVAGVRLSDLDEGALRRDGIVVRFGDPQGDETDLLGTAGLPKGAMATPEAHWLVAQVGRPPAVVRAGDAADAVRLARRVKP